LVQVEAVEAVVVELRQLYVLVAEVVGVVRQYGGGF
jgi:hypothetical protein